MHYQANALQAHLKMVKRQIAMSISQVQKTFLKRAGDFWGRRAKLRGRERGSQGKIGSEILRPRTGCEGKRTVKSNFLKRVARFTFLRASPKRNQFFRLRKSLRMHLAFPQLPPRQH